MTSVILLMCLLPCVPFAFAGEKPHIVCPKVLDVIFLLDGSGSVTSGYFDIQKDFAVRVAELLNPATAYVSVIAFSTTLQPFIPLAAITDAHKAAINALQREGGLTNTHMALNAMTDIFTTSGRDGACKVAIIVTDGKSSDETATAAAIKYAYGKHPNLNIIAIGVDDGVDGDELRLLGTGPGNSSVFFCQDFDHLVNEIGVTSEAACKLCEPTECGDDTCGPSDALKGECLDEECCWDSEDEECRIFP